MLAGDPRSEYRVLLTNTIYPVDPALGPLKPKYRLRSKRSRFQVRAVAAAAVERFTSHCLESRLSPGGESSCSSSSSSSDKEGFGSEGDEASVFEGVTPGVRLKVPREVWESGSETSGDDDNRGFEGCDVLEGEDAKVRGLSEDRESWLRRVIDQGLFDFPDALEVLRRCAGTLKPSKRKVMGGCGRYAVLGLYN